MIRVDFNPDNLIGEQREWWEAWERKAKAATEEVITYWEQRSQNEELGKFKPPFREDVWKELRDWLLDNFFHNKCAYCETPVIAAKFHAEHFRPKAQVRYKEEGNKRLRKGVVKYETAQVVSDRDKDVEHPGYFWLAYHWRNLLPSCAFCNTGSGKKDQFPVKKGHAAAKRLCEDESRKLKQQLIQSLLDNEIYYLQPEDLDELEDPLLLHPYVDELSPKHPRKHLIFGERGIVAAIGASELGRHSIEVYALNGPELTAARAREQESASTLYFSTIAATQGTRSQKKRAAEAVIAKYKKGESPYSAAVLDYLHGIFQGSLLDPYVPVEAVTD